MNNTGIALTEADDNLPAHFALTTGRYASPVPIEDSGPIQISDELIEELIRSQDEMQEHAQRQVCVQISKHTGIPADQIPDMEPQEVLGKLRDCMREAITPGNLFADTDQGDDDEEKADMEFFMIYNDGELYINDLPEDQRQSIRIEHIVECLRIAQGTRWFRFFFTHYYVDIYNYFHSLGDPQSKMQFIARNLFLENALRRGVGIDPPSTEELSADVISSLVREELRGADLPMLACNTDIRGLSTEFAGKIADSMGQVDIPSEPADFQVMIIDSLASSTGADLLNERIIGSVETAISPHAEEIRARIQAAIEDARKEVETAHTQFRGFYPVGGKIHFTNPIPDERFDEFMRQYGFASSPFTLMHANKSLLLPPRASAHELVRIIQGLAEHDIIQPDDDPEIQVSIPGRLNNQYAALLGSAMLLSSYKCIEYDEDSFSTTHESHTSTMIMVYDDGVLDESVTELPDGITGRTDMLGRKDPRDIYLYQILGSLISQAAYGGPFQKIGEQFIREYVQLLDKHCVLGMLDAPWIYDSASGEEPDTDAHLAAVRRCTDIWMSDFERANRTGKKEGLSFEVQSLLTNALNRIQSAQEAISVQEPTQLPPNSHV